VYRRLIAPIICAVLLALPALALEPPQPRAAEKLPALSVLSIIPAQGEPGMAVTLNGTGFTAATVAFLGSQQLSTSVVSNRLLTVELPDLPAGVYALYLRREDTATSRPYNFMLQPLKPVAGSLEPDNLPSCSFGRDREVALTGGNFLPGARVLLDGAAIASRYLSPSALTFVVPQIPAGLHQVQVRNPTDAASGNLALVIDSKPEILGVSVGAEYVSYYELIVNGRNFQQGSTLTADGVRVGTGQQVVGQREQLVFRGCNQLVYQRHPYDPTPREIGLQVINPSGEESGVFTISAP